MFPEIVPDFGAGAPLTAVGHVAEREAVLVAGGAVEPTAVHFAEQNVISAAPII